MPFFIFKVALLIALMNSMGIFTGYQTVPMAMAGDFVSPYAASTIGAATSRINTPTPRSRH
jgi:hypothetical protein